MASQEPANNIPNLSQTLADIDTSGPPPPANQATTENGEIVNLNDNPKSVVNK